MQNYCLGFLFSEDCSHVAMLTQVRNGVGLLNGVGGKLEDGEQPIDAMVREFQEETGVFIPASEWKYRADFGDDTYKVFVFSAFADAVYDVRTVEKEEVHILSVYSMLTSGFPLKDNIPELIPMCMVKDLVKSEEKTVPVTILGRLSLGKVSKVG